MSQSRCLTTLCLFLTIASVLPESLDPRIADWKGGVIAIYTVVGYFRKPRKGEDDRPRFREVGTTEPWLVMDTKRKFLLRDEARPIGDGLAVIVPIEAQVLPGVWLEADVRNGELRVVAIRSGQDGPDLTSTVLRKIGSTRDHLRERAVAALLRLHVDESGDVYGVTFLSPDEPDDDREWEELFAEAAAATSRRTARTGRPGRPPLTDAELGRVVRVARDARLQKRAMAGAVAEAFGITERAAAKRLRIARERGFEIRQED